MSLWPILTSPDLMARMIVSRLSQEIHVHVHAPSLSSDPSIPFSNISCIVQAVCLFNHSCQESVEHFKSLETYSLRTFISQNLAYDALRN